MTSVNGVPGFTLRLPMRNLLRFAVGTLFLLLHQSASAQEPVALTPGGNGPVLFVTQDAPIMLLPDAARQPLRVAKQGSRLTQMEEAGDWVGVRFQDPQFSVRTGYIQSRFVRTEQPPVARPLATQSTSPPPTLPATQETPPQEAAPPAAAPATDTQVRSNANPIKVGLYGLIGGGGVKDDTHDGARVTLGAAFRVGLLVLEVNPLDMAISPGDTYPYYRDTFSNGQSRCRNSLNGQFASNESCIAFDVSYFKSFGAGIVVPRSPVFVGVGRRFNDANNPWFGSGGVMGFFGEERFFGLARVEIGKSYLGGLAAFGVRLAGN